MKKGSIWDLLIFILGAELVGAISGIISGSSGGIYTDFAQPPLAPPAWVFPVVWVVLYALMGVSAYLVYSSQAEQPRINRALMLYALQLFVNFWWSIIFFRFELLLGSVITIFILLVLVALMIISFVRVKPSAAYLNLPYLVWLAFAAYLNIGILVLNS